MKRQELGVMLLTALLTASSMGAYAYLTDEESLINEVNPADCKISVEEDFKPPDKLRPGIDFVKKPRVSNDSAVDCYIRVRVIFEGESEAFCEPLSINEGWNLKEDGFYYWNEPLAPGELTDALFDTVKIRDDIAEYELQPFEIQIYAEGTLTAGLSANEAWALLDGEAGDAA